MEGLEKGLSRVRKGGSKYVISTVALNLWVTAPLGSEQSFHQACLRPWENTDIYIACHNSGKIAVMK